MKKIGYLLLVALLAVLMLVSCGGEEECAHSFSAATCTTPEICTLCGIEQGVANGHNLVKGAVHTPTCATDGYTDYACSECDFTEIGDKITMLGHKLTKGTVHAPTCTTDGYTEYACSECDFTVVDDKIGAIGHSFGEWVNNDEVKLCDKVSVLTRSCQSCGATEVENSTPSTHSLVFHSGVEPTCTENGYEDYNTCENCDYTTFEEILAAHAYTESVIPPTCTEQGYTTHTCSRCGDSYNDSIENATDHTLVFHEGKPSTCTENGYKDYNTCENCDYTTFEEILAAHTYTETVLPPTCLDGGYTTHTCSRCGHSYNDKFENATGHTMGAWYQSSDATTTSDGEMRSSCLNCAYYETKGLTVVATGNFGKGTTPTDSAIWTLYENGTLKIKGEGATFDCGWNGASQPFKEYRDRITKLVIGEGITENTKGDFANLSNLTAVEFPTTFKKINTNAFMDSFKKGITSITIPKQVTYIGTFIFGYYATNNATFTDIIIENPDITFYTNPSSPTNEISIFNRGNHNKEITLYSYGPENNVSAYAKKIGAAYVDLNAEISGSAGNLAYKFFDGELTINAKDVSTVVKMPDKAPWLDLIDKGDVITLKIGEGITEIPSEYFSDYTALKSISLSDTVTSIGSGAFSTSSACNSPLAVHFSNNVSTLGSEIFKNRSSVTVHAFSGTAAETYTEQGVTVLLQKVFRLLLLGNSLSLDAADNSGGGTASILYDIIKSMLGENSFVEIATLYSGARTAAWHATMARDEVSAYQFSIISDETDGKWSVISTSCTSKYGLEYADWDVVTIQPYGNETLTGVDDATTGTTNSYKDPEFLPLSVSLPFLLNYIKANSAKSEIYYYLTWASSQSAWMNTGATTYSGMVDVAISAISNSGKNASFSGIIPVGTAIQNARSTYLSLLRYDNSADVQKNLQRDNVHLSLHLGRYIAALTFAEILVPASLRAPDYDLPTVTDSPTAGSLPIGYTEIARKAVNAAVASASLDGAEKYRPTTISGYETDPSAIHASKVSAMSFKGLKATDAASLIAAIKEIAASGAPEGAVITVTVNGTPTFTSTPSAFSATVTVRYGYMEASVQISGTVTI